MLTKQRYRADGTDAGAMTYTYNDQDQLAQVQDSGLTVMQMGYDHKRQRIYTYTWGAGDSAGPKCYYWDTQGRIIGEYTEQWHGTTVRYIYSGNQKVAMARPKNLSDLSQGEDIFYFINNAQGTPVMIVDGNNHEVSRINLDEWGNAGTVIGPKAEINYTGKKLDPATGLYYFNQRYYDPEVGRFLTEDPAGQCFNPYLYAGNNPMMYVDPDGEFFQFLLPYIVAAAQGAALSAVTNIGMQLAMTGQVNWGQVGQSAVGGALGGALSFGVGEMFKHGTTDLGQFATKTAAHGISGGIQSWAQGGDFGSGFMAGSVGHVTGELGGRIGGDVGGFIGSGLGGGISASLAGGEFGRGFQTGAMQYMFNKTAGQMAKNLVDSGVYILDQLLHRDEYNTAPQTENIAKSQKWIKCSGKESLLHKIGGSEEWNNTKYVSANGHFEGVYKNGKLITSGINKGTYNIFSHIQNPAMHGLFDVAPFFLGM